MPVEHSLCGVSDATSVQNDVEYQILSLIVQID